MEKITKTSEEIDELKDLTQNGVLISELINKINEIVDWINEQ